MNKINMTKWKEFVIRDIFTVKRPYARSQSNYEAGEIAFVASGNYNNGVLKYLTPKHSEQLDKGNCITVSPIDGSAFYQEKDFLGRGGAGSSIILLYNNKLNLYNGYFIATVIRIVCQKYAYSDMANKDTIGAEIIKLPVDNIGNPDYLYMENYMRKLENTTDHLLTILRSARNFTNCKRIDTTNWKSFKPIDFFEILPIHSKLDKSKLGTFGSVPVYSSTSENNGIAGYCEETPSYVVDTKETIYLIFGDHTKAMFIAQESFCVMDNVKVLKPKIKNPNIVRFICTVWQKNIPNIGYTRYWNIAKNVNIKLPIDKNGYPDYKYMENYIKCIQEKNLTNIGTLNAI